MIRDEKAPPPPTDPSHILAPIVLPSRPHPLVLLSLAAGCIDATAFLQAGVFPANMTGNTVILALQILRLEIPAAALAGMVLLAFCVGAAVGALILGCD